MRISVKAPVDVTIDFELDTAAIGRAMALRLVEIPAEQRTPRVLIAELERAIRGLGPLAICPTIPEPSDAARTIQD